jgi:ATP-dependent Clp protease adaptor protein ClpS
MPDDSRQTDGQVVERTERKVQEPDLYRVILLNDDYTTMDFVVRVLEEVFHKGPAEAYHVMMLVHTQGRGVAGHYPFEVAETKVTAVVDRARAEGFPLQATMEKA